MSGPSARDDHDVVVVGAGPAGLCTAIAAAEAGARVALLDKQGRLGGMLHIANGEFSGAGTRRQAARGIEDDPRRHFEDVLRLSHGQVDRELAWLSVSRQGGTVDWLDAAGFDFHPDTPGLVHGHEVYDTPRTYWGRRLGLSVLRVLAEQLQPFVDAGRVALHLRTRVAGLARTGDGRMLGVTAVADGSRQRVTAPAVVLATGGYEAAPRIRNRFLAPEHAGVLIGCLDHATGDGLVLAEEAGAAVTGRGFFLPVMGLIPDPDRPGHAVDYRRAYLELAPAYRTPHEIWVDRRGERFVAEDGDSPERRERALLRQPGMTMHVVFDRAGAEAAPVPLIRNGAGDWTREEFLRACDDSPWITRADTLAELATRLGADPGTLQDTVAGYGTAVDAGRDDAFGRTVLPGRIERPPFYAVTSVAASILSRDGLRVDAELAVLDTAGTAIPGLHAVGEILGNNAFAGDSYVGGMSVTPAMTLGRLLGGRLARSVVRSSA